ncbi:GNAT family N-acetyltransferase [Rubellicoccus peritrichatus]|uniref:GNAT family N-acetyltransferase n=1 Tax=Rubellicoccus peritrichatus TaxID=3080537 RepID=A0AAQ3LGH2_9BACT|nr:GNAT family N-acetyltransferase [Puniceicoccus sp. CR14]WOO41674.1 GNAT family N-acetyltransferase [Puniceicoccus sp. CR14]
MFIRQINDRTKISLSVPQYADELFALTDKNRTMLRQWLPWLDHTKEPKDTRDFITAQLSRFTESKALHTTIFYDDRIAGVLAFNTIDSQNRAGHIGYWLGSDFQGKGIMTECVKDLMKIGEDFFSLERFEIRCAVENSKSRAIPERLDFQNEGTIRRAERVYENWYDHIVYGKIKSC